MGYLEFIARVTSHIPDKGQVMVRYHGLYANANIYRSSQSDVCGGEAPAVPFLRAGRARGGRGAGGVFFMTGDFERDGKSIIFWSISRSFGTKICPDGVNCGHSRS